MEGFGFLPTCLCAGGRLGEKISGSLVISVSGEKMAWVSRPGQQPNSIRRRVHAPVMTIGLECDASSFGPHVLQQGPAPNG